MKQFIKDKMARLMQNRIARNFIVLLTGEGIISIIGMINLAIIVNTIGLDKNGIIIMVQTYALLFNNIFGFRSFQALIKYASIAIEQNDSLRIKTYIKLSYILDIIAAFVAVFFGFVCLDVVIGFMKWDMSLKPYIRIFLLATLTYIQGTPIGILRVYNKFNYITYTNVITNFIKLVLYIFGFITKMDLDFFFAIEVITFIVPNIVFIIFSQKTLKNNNLGDFYRVKTIIDKDFLSFNFYSNITSTIDIPVNYLTTMILNKYLGFTEISIYKIFEKLGSIIGKLGMPLNQIIYPEMSFLIAKKDFESAKRLNKKLFMGITAIGTFFIGFIGVTYRMWLGIFIKDYNLYIWPLILYFGFMIFINATVGLQNLFMALGYMKHNIPILLVVNSLYLVVLFFLIKTMGLTGVILALFIQAVAVVVIKLIIMKKVNYREYSRTLK